MGIKPSRAIYFKSFTSKITRELLLRAHGDYGGIVHVYVVFVLGDVLS